jgi:hypothetical protein
MEKTTTKLLLVVMVLQVFLALEVAMTQDFPSPHEAVCQIVDWVPFVPDCEAEK